MSVGILPIGTSSFWVSPDQQVASWGLPGHGASKGDCGSFFSVGCIHVEDHFRGRIDGEDVIGKAFVRRKKVSCKEPKCPVCYESWAGREAHRIEHRILSFRLRGARAIHFMVSPPPEVWHLSVDRLRTKAYSVARKVGFLGGNCIYHPFREVEETKLWYFSPHFHMIGYGWIKGAGEEYLTSGWVSKNLGVRDSVYATAFYQLSHCGVWYGVGRRHSVTWFGKLSYNKLKADPEVVEKEVCPLCGAELRKLLWGGGGALPVPIDVEGDYFLDPEGWREVSARYRYQNV